MLTLGLTLMLLAEPSARLLPEEPPLSPEEITSLDREMRILNGNIQEMKPRIPTGFAVGMAIGFSFSVLLLPGVPLLIAGSLTTSGVLFIGGFLSGLGGLGLVSAVICLVLGNNAESDMADERAQMVEKRDAIRARLPRPPPNQVPIPAPQRLPQYVPGVQRDLPSPPLVLIARF